MKKTLAILIGAALMTASVSPVAFAAETHHGRRGDRVRAYRSPAVEQFRHANDALLGPAQAPWFWAPSESPLQWYVDAHALSPPAGR